MDRKIAPSMMCIDLMNAEQSVRVLEKAGADYLHIDVMDNHFVPNITMCPDFVRQLKKITKVPLDIHLMIEKPENSLHFYQGLNANDIITVHYEASLHIQRSLSAIRQMGLKAGLALNPATHINALEYLLDDIDMVLIMTVNPGFAGQKLIDSTLGKIKALRTYLAENSHMNIMIEVDGNVSFENAVKMREMGADIYVGGSSSVFCPGASIEENCRKLRQIINPV